MRDYKQDRQNSLLQGKQHTNKACLRNCKKLVRRDYGLRIASIALLVGSCQEAYSFPYPASQQLHKHQVAQNARPLLSSNEDMSLSQSSFCKSILSSISIPSPILFQNPTMGNSFLSNNHFNSDGGIGSNTALFMVRGDKSSYDANNGWSRPATVNDMDTNTSSTTNERKESRFGVRSRVRTVLEKAKKRTGIRNNSEESLAAKEPSPQSVIAEAASIGGLGAVIVDEVGTIDVALDYVNNTTELSTSSSKAQRNVKKAQASTYSPSSIKIQRGPEDRLRTSSSESSIMKNPISERDAFTGDVSAAFSLPPPPLPFTLPTLTKEQARQVDAGERVQFQNDMGREGSGFVVVDVKAPPEAV